MQRRHPIAVNTVNIKTSDGDEVDVKASASGVTAAASPSRSTNARRRRRSTTSSFMRVLQQYLPIALMIVGATVLILCAVFAAIQLINAFFNNQASKGDSSSNVLPFNPLYQVPRSMPHVGDRSDAYVLLRKEMDQILPPGDADRSMAFVQDLLRRNQRPQPQQDSAGGFLVHAGAPGVALMDAHQSDQVTYDIYDCPDQPPAGYPFAWKLVDEVLLNWPVDQTTLPAKIHQGLCVFDYHRDYDKAQAYRKAEVPFVVINDPAVAEVVERWAQPRYLEQMLGPHIKHRAEYSENNHFMYYSVSKRAKRLMSKDIPENWKEPTQQIRMTYSEWLNVANVTDDHLGPDKPHWYFRLIGCGGMGHDGSCDRGSSEYLFDELTFFQPTESLYIVDPKEQKGIHCRFGMKGVIAENHWDGSRNAIVVLGGSRRYILAHPDQCSNMALFPKGHPSARHSATDWSHARENLEQYPQFANAMANEVILQAGHVLYLPIFWFHFIVSLELNYQCNTRSGGSDHYREAIRQCGF